MTDGNNALDDSQEEVNTRPELKVIRGGGGKKPDKDPLKPIAQIGAGLLIPTLIGNMLNVDTVGDDGNNVISPFDTNYIVRVCDTGTGQIIIQYTDGTQRTFDKKDVPQNILAMAGQDVNDKGGTNSSKKEEANSSKKEGGKTSKLQKGAKKIIANAKAGKIKYAKNYHGRLGKELELDILSNPDAVYVSGNKSQNLIYRKGDNVVIVESTGSSIGNVITSYGPSGPRGKSGAAIFGGNPSDPGMPVTHDAIVNGKISTPSGETMPPATQIYP